MRRGHQAISARRYRMPAMPPKISICMLACDEEQKITHALKSARACAWCDELLVFDSGSNDDTVGIARQYADRVEHHAWVNFSTNRRKLVEAATHDWVFILDADEEISPELAAEIAGLSGDMFERHPAMTMPRRNYLLGRHVRAWDPDRIDRLFDRRRVRWPEREVHDYRELTEGTRYELRAPIVHNAHANDWADYFDGARYAARADALAKEMYAQGRRARWIDLWVRPWMAFWKFYLLKGAILDGAFGLLIAQKAAFSVQLKYARLWHMQREAGSNAKEQGR